MGKRKGPLHLPEEKSSFEGRVKGRNVFPSRKKGKGQVTNQLSKDEGKASCPQGGKKDAGIPP